MTRPSPAACRACVMTPAGRGAVASILLSGSQADVFAHVGTLFEPAGRQAADADGLPTTLARIRYGRWGNEPAEDVVVCRTDATAWELNCHGGRVAVARILEDLQQAGFVVESWRDVPAAGKTYLEQEYNAALAACTTWGAAKRLLSHPTAEFVDALQRLEVVLSSAEEPDWERWEAWTGEVLEFASFGRHLSEPWQVLLVGRPNVGKSSLLNRLAGYARAIVHDQPGTTRDLVSVDTALEGWPIRFTDSAGVRQAAEALESEGIQRSLQAAAGADLVLFLFDVSQRPEAEDEEIARRFPHAVKVAHKMDLERHPERQVQATDCRVSSATGAGLEELAQTVVQRLIPKPPAGERMFPVNRRQQEGLERLRECLIRRDRDGSAAAVHGLLYGPE